jgi:PAS domain S-box-containing protein
MPDLSQPVMGAGVMFHPVLFEHHPLPMWVCDPNTLRIVAVNDSAIERYGYRREEFLALTAADLGEPGDLPALRRAMAAASAGPSRSGPWRHVRKGGDAIMMRLTASPLDYDGRPARLVMAQEVAASAEAEERARQAESLQHHTARMARLGSWTVDLVHDRIGLSDEVCAILEVPPGTVLTMAEAMHFYPRDWRQHLDRILKACIREAQPYDEELEIVTAKGRRIWVRTIGEPVLGPAGDVIRINGALQDISDRSRSHQSLVSSDQRFRRLADSVPQIVWTADPDGSIDFLSRAFFDYVGQARDAMEAWTAAFHPDDRAASTAAWNLALMTGDDFVSEFRLRRASDGMYRWHLSQARPVRDDAGRIVKWYGSSIDVHDRREAEEAARRLAARLNNTLESISDGFYMLDRDWRYTFVNREAERLLRRPRDELLGSTIWEAWPEAAASELGERYRAAMESGQPASFETWYEGLQGWFDVNVYPSDDGLAVYFRDITERRRTEARIRDFQARFETLVDKAIIGILVHVDLKLVFVNRALVQMLGYDRAEEVLALPSALDLFAEDERERLVRYATDRKAGHSAPDTYSLLGLRRDGTVIEMENRAFPIEWAGQLGICSTLVDVTEQRAMEAQLRQAQRLEAVGRLTGGLAHDFNNLLTVILGNAEMLAEGVAHDPELVQLAELIQKAANRGADLNSRLLAFARRQTLDPKAIDVGALIGGMEGLLRHSLGAQIEIETVTPPGLWDALADAAQLESALLNLCLNARDAMPDGGRLTVEVANVTLDRSYADWDEDLTPGDYVLVAVSDTGTGMPPEVVTRAFDPFFTTKEVGAGSGLGLSMVFGFVKQSRGHVQIYSEVGHGTTVKLYLPRAGHDEERAEAESGGPAETPGGSECILLVEDDPLVREHVVSLLRSLGYRVVAAENGPEALGVLAGAGRFDLLFTDMVMPGGMNGRRLAEEATRLRPGLRVLFTSGYTDDAMIRQGRLDRGVHFLDKPYRREELAAKLRQVLAPS